MAEFVSDWLHFDNQQPKRKRADLVCSACHTKKVKCDLQSKSADGGSVCSNCHTTGTDCHVRPSKRKKNAHSNQRSLNTDPGPDPDSYRRSPSPPSPLEARRGSVVSVPPIPAHAPLSSTPLIVEPLQQPQPQPQQPPRPPRGGANGTPQSQHTNDLLTGAATGRSNPSDVDTGFLNVFAPETQIDAERQFEAAIEPGHGEADGHQQELQQIYAETYMDFCYPWCPVLDVERIAEDTLRSPLLANALALAGSHIRPPLLPHEGPAEYYKRASSLFYNDEETGGIVTLQAISLFYWWAPRSISVAHRHSSWWWTSVVIRHAQQMNFHREPSMSHPLRNTLNLSLRRRIWWTAFARERLTALCQSKPCIIDPSDCSISAPTLADFPSDPKLQRKGEIFIRWISLCAIIGRVAKNLSRPGAAFPVHLRQELVDWVSTMPAHLQLPIGSARTQNFDRDIHQLYLPYLTTIIILHLRRSAHDLPQALPPAILAASCIARILRDILSRGDTRFLMAITCWYSGTAFTALLQACRIPRLAQDANDGLDVLTNAVEQLQQMWGSAHVIRQGFDRLRRGHTSGSGAGPGTTDVIGAGRMGVLEANPFLDPGNAHEVLDTVDDFNWTVLFPFVTASTGGIAKALLQGPEPGMATQFPSPENIMYQDAFMVDYHGLLEPFSQWDTFGFGDVRFPI
ncbi:hypothetical protein OQA88_5950 [Cercophora sp. LCS_1]